MLAAGMGNNARSRVLSVKDDSAPALKAGPSLVAEQPVGIRLPAEQGDLSPRIAEYLATHDLSDPCLVVDVDIVEHNYVSLTRALPLANVFYAVKANPSDAVVRRLADLGSNFDAASLTEVDLCLGHGVSPTRISFGNTIKKESDIARAYERGVRLFAFDSDAELEKIANAAPGSRVHCRLLVPSDGAEWPLSRKFGCEPEMALRMLVKAKRLGLDAHGISFHVGSQQTDPGQWDHAIGLVSKLFADAERLGVELRMINLGGGLPARYRGGVRPPEDYASAIMDALMRHFGPALPEIIIEPGRSIAGDAGVIQAEIVLISRKSDNDPVRWVYLDIGKFSGLAETMDESIKYRFLTPHDGGKTGPVVLAGPTCDSADILYEKTLYEMPLDLQIGDKVRILSTGAYTATYSSVGFNGFAPLRTICI
jgi:ornithine decarboxylase